MENQVNNNQISSQPGQSNKDGKGEVEVLESKPFIQPEKKQTVNIGTLNFYNSLPLRLQERYKGKEHHFWWDLVFVVLIILLGGFNLFLLFGGNTYFSLRLGEKKVIEINKQESGQEPGSQQSTSTLVVKENSNLQISGLARYFTLEGDQLGRGPLPPQVGESTSYWIFWKLENNPNALANVQVSGKLAANVSFTGRSSVVEGGNLKYDSSTNRVTWIINNISSGQTISQAGFEVSLTPAANQTGSVALLIQNIFASAKDLVSGQNIQKSAADISTYNISTETGKNLEIISE